MINIIKLDQVFPELKKNNKSKDIVKFAEGEGELVQIFTKFSKVEDNIEGENYLWAYISSEEVDSDGEIIQPEAIEEAWPDYIRYGNLREMHQPIIAGKVVESEFDSSKRMRWVKAKVTKDIAQKIKDGMINGLSIGGEVLEKIGNIITKLRLFEISAVDRPANPQALIVAFKRFKEETKNETIGEDEMNEELKKAGFTIQDLIAVLKSAKKEDPKETDKPEDKKDDQDKKEEAKKAESEKPEDKKDEEEGKDKTEDKKDKTEKSVKLEDVLSGLNVILKNTEDKDNSLTKSVSALASKVCELADSEVIVFSGEESQFEEVSKSLEVLKSFKSENPELDVVNVEIQTESVEEFKKTIKYLEDEIAELKKSAVFETKNETKTVRKSLKTNASISDAGVVEEEEETIEEIEKAITLARESFAKSQSSSDQENLIGLLMKRNMLKA